MSDNKAPGVPSIPAQLTGHTAVSQFVAIWQRVAELERADSLPPLTGPCTVLAVSNDALQRVTPCDVSDPFEQDELLQRTLIRRHVLQGAPVPAAPSDGDTKKLSLAGPPPVRVGRDQEGRPVFSVAGVQSGPQQVAGQLVAAVERSDCVVYQLEWPLISLDDVTAAIQRHPQQPFCGGCCEPPAPTRR